MLKLILHVDVYLYAYTQEQPSKRNSFAFDEVVKMSLICIGGVLSFLFCFSCIYFLFRQFSFEKQFG